MEQEQAVVVRPSREADVDAMLAIYRHHIRRGVEEGVDDGETPQTGRGQEWPPLEIHAATHCPACQMSAVAGWTERRMKKPLLGGSVHGVPTFDS